jgi:predicted nuclease of predicted toxin-antitoxin system
MLILVDQSAPRGLRTHFPDHDVVLARQRGWHELTNGDLIAAAEAGGFDVLITADQNIQYQQNLSGRRLALVVLTTNHWDTISPNVARIVAAVEAIEAGGYVTIAFDRPPLRRRLYDPLRED